MAEKTELVLRVPDALERQASTNPFEGLIEAWLRGKSRATLKAYQRDLEDFATWCGVQSPAQAVSELLELGPGPAARRVADYQHDLRTRPVWRSERSRLAGEPPDRQGLARATINRRLSAIKSVTELANMFGMINWRLQVPWLKVKPYRDVAGPSDQDFERVREYLLERLRVGESRTQQAIARRDWALFVLLSGHGLRRSEVLNLRWPDDVELEKRMLWLVEKGDDGQRDQREGFALSHAGVRAIEQYLEARGEHPGALILGFSRRSSRTSGLHIRKVNQILTEWGIEAGCKAPIRPHGFRHRAITKLCERYAVQEVQRFSRHKKLDTLLRYNDRRLETPHELVAALDED